MRERCQSRRRTRQSRRAVGRLTRQLQFNARVSKPDPRFAALLLEQFGGPNGELKAAMQYFVQSFTARQAHRERYDVLMDIATEEFSHLEIVGATITMLLDGINGDLKDVAEQSPVTKLAQGASAKEEVMHEALTQPQFLVLSGVPERPAPLANEYTRYWRDSGGSMTEDEIQLACG